MTLKPSTRARYAGIVAKHVVPRWGATPIAAVTHADVATWLTGLVAGVDTRGRQTRPLAAATVRYIHRVFSLILALAVADGRLTKNPADRVRLPRAATSEKRFLTHARVAALAEAAGDDRLLVLVAAYCGPRWGELAALRVRPST